MSNQYWLVNILALTESRFRNFTTRRDLQWESAHRNIHYRLSNDRTKAIIQADFPPSILAILATQPWATYLGEYKDGTASPGVFEYMAANPNNWGKVREV
jgi:hypothetical protein